jgi:hypothetical protein
MPSTLQQLQEHSASATELVLSHDDALRALDLLERAGARVVGWGGWLRRADGRLGHSASFQGTADLSHVPSQHSFSLCRKTISEAYDAHKRRPELPGSDLLFCITHDV